MKCEELKYERLGDANKTYPASTLVIRKQYVDAAIAELKRENERLKRALWLARADRAVAKQAYYDILCRGISIERDEMYDVWNNVELKCRAKAEEYK